jgi:hypothetical protein
MPLPRWVRPNPGKGKHGVPDKDAHKIGMKWERDAAKKREGNK